MRTLLALGLFSILPHLAFAATIHVAPEGKPDATGAADAPLNTVQAGLNKAVAGDTVLLTPGVYRERVKFSKGGEFKKPVILEGKPGAILDASDTEKLEWTPAPEIAEGCYRLKLKWAPFTIVADGKLVTTLREDRVKSPNEQPEWDWKTIFKQGVGPSGWKGVRALALYFKHKDELLLKFEKNLDPRKMDIRISPKEPAITIEGVDRCVVRNLKVINASTGIHIQKSLGSVVEKCTISQTDYCLWLASGADRCTLRFNDISNDPLAMSDPYDRGSWDNWKAHKTGGHYDRYGIQINDSVGGHEIHDNNIHDVWDGIEDRGNNVGLRIHHNRIYMLNDDGLEPNGTEVDCQWYSNYVENTRCGLRIKAPEIGPLYVYRNIFKHNKEDIRNFGSVELKPAVVYVYHNTTTSSMAICSNKVKGIGTPNYHFYNNLFYCEYWWMNAGESEQPNFKSDFNVLAKRGESKNWEESKALATKLNLETHSHWTAGEVGDFTLKEDSPARGKGTDLSKLLKDPLPGCPPGYFKGDAPDAGALSFGEPFLVVPRKPEDVKVPEAGSWPEEK